MKVTSGGVACVLGVVLAVLTLGFGVYVYVESRVDTVRVENQWRGPYSSYALTSVGDNSVTVIVSNPAKQLAHNVNVWIEYPPGCTLAEVFHQGFDRVKGGVGESFVHLRKGEMNPGVYPRAITLSVTDQNGEHAKFPYEVTTWADEDSGSVAIPPGAE